MKTEELIIGKQTSLVDQCYKIVDARLGRICAAQFKSKKGNRKTTPKSVTYSQDVFDMVCFLNELASENCTNERAEEIYSLVTTGQINNTFEKAIS